MILQVIVGRPVALRYMYAPRTYGVASATVTTPLASPLALSGPPAALTAVNVLRPLIGGGPARFPPSHAENPNTLPNPSIPTSPLASVASVVCATWTPFLYAVSVLPIAVSFQTSPTAGAGVVGTAVRNVNELRTGSIR